MCHRNEMWFSTNVWCTIHLCWIFACDKIAYRLNNSLSWLKSPWKLWYVCVCVSVCLCVYTYIKERPGRQFWNPYKFLSQEPTKDFCWDFSITLKCGGVWYISKRYFGVGAQVDTVLRRVPTPTSILVNSRRRRHFQTNVLKENICIFIGIFQRIISLCLFDRTTPLTYTSMDWRRVGDELFSK